MNIWSHSKINLLMEDLFSYFLNYKMKVKPIEKSRVLSLGEAVHYALEHENSDLDEFFKENGTLEQKNTYSYEQILAESLSQTYLGRKDEILSNIVGNAKILQVDKEIKFEVSIDENNSFLGIIDLLITTDKGFIVIDYKTTSKTPNYDDYIEQLYRYCFILSKAKPEIPIYKIAIISLRKSGIKQKMNENEESFKRRLILDYKERSDEYITWHTFDSEEDKHIFNKEILEEHHKNLINLIKTCDKIDKLNLFPKNYSKAQNIYGLSQYYDFIFWNQENILSKFYISDKWYNEELDTIEDRRSLNNLDLEIIKNSSSSILNDSIVHYSKFLQVIDNDIKNYNEEEIYKKYLVDLDLLRNYKKVFEIENEK